MDIRQYFYLFRRWAWLLILGTIGGLTLGFIISSLQVPTYQTATKVMVSSSPNGMTSNPYAIFTDQQLALTYVQILTTKPMLEKVSEHLGYPLANIEISARQVDERSPIIQISVTGTDPQKIADVANELVIVLIEQNQILQAGQYATSEESLQVQIEQVEQQVAKYQSDLDNLSSKSLSEQITQVQTQMDPLQVEVAQLQKDITLLTPAISQENKIKIADMQARLDQLVPLLNLYQQIYTNLVVLGNPGAGVDTNSLVLTRLQSTLDLYQKIYLNLINSREAIRLARLQNTPNVVQIEAAGVPASPTRPRPLNDSVLASVFGLMLTAGIAFLIEYLDDTIKTPEDVERQLSLSVIGYIGDMQFENKGDEVLFVTSQPRSPVAEAFRSLRANLEFASVDKPLHSILVTSPSPGEGKTTVASNLAAIIAQAGRTAILVDADLRRPRVHRLLGISNRLGLTDLFRDHSSFKSVRNEWSAHAGLTVITSGSLPPNPAELLGSDRMLSILEELSSAADLVIVDSAPTVVADAQVLASRVDGVVLVIRPGHTSIKDAMIACEQFQRAGGRVLGVIFNRIPKNEERYYGGYQYYSGHYYTDHPSALEQNKKPIMGKIQDWLPWKKSASISESTDTNSDAVAVEPDQMLPSSIPVKSTPKKMPDVAATISAPSVSLNPLNTKTILGLESVIGSEFLFRIHQVQKGEKLVSIARSDGTTISAIASINHNFSTPFKDDQVIIIPVKQMDVSHHPSFEAYRISESITLQKLAASMKLDAAQLQYYNGIEPDYLLTEGEWVIIPRGKSKI